jgi:hypothetical protein
MKWFLLAIICLFHFQSKAQQNSAPCSAAEASEFDFWVGDWNLTWNDTLHGTNHIEKLYGNCTIHENFKDPRSNFLGQSWSVYNPNTKLWQQTWIDNQGGYIVLTGNKVGNSIILKTQERVTPNGKRQMRMVYEKITPDSFDWRWEQSTDSGITWKTNWLIHYKRASN